MSKHKYVYYSLKFSRIHDILFGSYKLVLAPIEKRNLLQIDSTHFHKKLCHQVFKSGKFVTMTSKL